MHTQIVCQFGMKGCEDNVLLRDQYRVAIVPGKNRDAIVKQTELRRADEDAVESCFKPFDVERRDERIDLSAVSVAHRFDFDKSPARLGTTFAISQKNCAGAGPPSRQAVLDGAFQLDAKVAFGQLQMKGRRFAAGDDDALQSGEVFGFANFDDGDIQSLKRTSMKRERAL